MEIEKFSIKRLTASGLVSNEPCYVAAICGVGLTAATNRFSVYNGHSTSDTLVMDLVAVAYDRDFRAFGVPMYFNRGLYVDFTTNGYSVTVLYLKQD